MEERKSYTSIFKATALFGGVQVIQVLIQLIRSKIVAILLGPSGIGLLGLFNSTINFIGSITNFGLGTSAINEITSSNQAEDKHKLNTTISVLKTLVWFTGLIGMLICIIFAPILSSISFGNHKYTFAFVGLSIAVLLNQLTYGNIATLQGLRKLSFLAKANILGSLIGLIFSVPLFYFWRSDGIVSSIVVYAFSVFLFSSIFVKKLDVKYVFIGLKEKFVLGRSMLSLGFILGLSGLLNMFTSYLISLFIVRLGDIQQLGLYSSGLAIATNYTGLIFTAIATDYHPRLVSLPDNKSLSKVVNQQAEITLIILTPLILIFLVYGELLINLLYSKDFISIKPMICWMLIGSFFKLFSWAISFTFVARGRIKLFFWNELTANIYVLVFGLLGFYFLGLLGLGYSFVFSYIFYSIQVYILAVKNFDFSYDYKFILKFLTQFSTACIVYALMVNLSTLVGMLIGTIIILLVLYFSICELREKLDLKSLLKFDKVEV